MPTLACRLAREFWGIADLTLEVHLAAFGSDDGNRDTLLAVGEAKWQETITGRPAGREDPHRPPRRQPLKTLFSPNGPEAPPPDPRLLGQLPGPRDEVLKRLFGGLRVRGECRDQGGGG